MCIRDSLITLAKGLGGIGIPVAAILYRPELEVLEPFEHSFTSGGNPLALVAAVETIKVLTQEGILTNVLSNEVFIKRKLKRIYDRFQCIGDVRGNGYMWGLEVINETGDPGVRLTNLILETALTNHNLILRSSEYGFGNVIKFRPALNTNQEDLTILLDALDRSIEDSCREF